MFDLLGRCGLGSGGLFLDLRHPETKGRSLAWLAADIDLADVRGEDGAGDGKTHTGAFAKCRTFLAAIEFFEDQWKLGRLDAGAIVFHREFKAAVASPAGKCNAASYGRIARGIFDQVAEDASEQMGIEPCGSIRGFNRNDNLMPGESRMGLFEDM